MTENHIFPPLTDWEPTRETLHWHARAIGVIPRALVAFHPKWWHISLKVRPDGLYTEPMALPNGDEFRLIMDIAHDKVILQVDGRIDREFRMDQGLTATEFGDQLLEAVSGLGLSGKYLREKFEDDHPREYSPKAAAAFWKVLVRVDRIFKERRASLSGELGPVQLWPHGFDLAFEWFGSRIETYEEDGQLKEYSSQINLGFYPGDSTNRPYFYSNPWPFKGQELLEQPLPGGARWQTEGWQGTILPYDELAGDSQGEERLREYARAVYEVCVPTLV